MKKKTAGIVLTLGLLLSPIAVSAGESVSVLPHQTVPPNDSVGGPGSVFNITRSGTNTWTANFTVTVGPAAQQHRAIVWDNRGSRVNPVATGPWVARSGTSRASITNPIGTVRGTGQIR